MEKISIALVDNNHLEREETRILLRNYLGSDQHIDNDLSEKKHRRWQAPQTAWGKLRGKPEQSKEEPKQQYDGQAWGPPERTGKTPEPAAENE